MRIAVMGAGGVGGYLAARLAEARNAEVHLLARGEHLRALQRDGLTLRSVFGDAHVHLPAVEDPSEIGPVDVVLFTVKATDTEEAAARLAPLVGERTAVVTFQNGVAGGSRLADAVGPDKVLGGSAFIFSTIAAPGVIEHTGGPTRFVFGELDGRRTPRAEALLETLRVATIDAELSSDVRAVMWQKYVFICAQAGMTSATRLPIGDIRDDPESWAMFRQVLAEVAAVAAAEGVRLPGDPVKTALDLAVSLSADSRSSMYHDLAHGNPMELATLNGYVVQLARKHGIDVPANTAINALLSPWAKLAG